MYIWKTFLVLAILTASVSAQDTQQVSSGNSGSSQSATQTPQQSSAGNSGLSQSGVQTPQQGSSGNSGSSQSATKTPQQGSAGNSGSSQSATQTPQQGSAGNSGSSQSATQTPQQGSSGNSGSSQSATQTPQQGSSGNSGSSQSATQTPQQGSAGNSGSSQSATQTPQQGSSGNSGSSQSATQTPQQGSAGNSGSSQSATQTPQQGSAGNSGSSQSATQTPQQGSSGNSGSSQSATQTPQQGSSGNSGSSPASSGDTTSDVTTPSEASISSEESTSSEGSTSTEAVSTTTTNALPSNPRINQICTGNPGMNDRIRTRALEMTNYRRSRLARGFVSKFNGRRLPMAADMIKLRYNCSLETSAKAAVDSCTTSYSNIPSGVQQNIYSIPKSRAHYRVDAIAEAIKEWWRQAKRNDAIGMKVTYRAKHESSPISWFTRMAWAKTTTLGCAVSLNCGSMWYAACHYYPGGNIVDDVVYMKGYPCTACPQGYFCTTGLLCGAAADI